METFCITGDDGVPHEWIELTRWWERLFGALYLCKRCGRKSSEI